MNQQQRIDLGREVTAARLGAGLGKEAAARDIGVSSITLKRVEDGERVRDDILARVLGFFGLPMPGVAPAPADPHDDLRRRILAAKVSDNVKSRLLALLDEAGGEDLDPPITAS